MLRVKSLAEIQEIADWDARDEVFYLKKELLAITKAEYFTISDAEWCGKFIEEGNYSADLMGYIEVEHEDDIGVLPDWACEIIPETNFDRI